MVNDSDSAKPRGYAFIEYQHEKNMHGEYAMGNSIKFSLDFYKMVESFFFVTIFFFLMSHPVDISGIFSNCYCSYFRRSLGQTFSYFIRETWQWLCVCVSVSILKTLYYITSETVFLIKDSALCLLIRDCVRFIPTLEVLYSCYYFRLWGHICLLQKLYSSTKTVTETYCVFIRDGPSSELLFMLKYSFVSSSTTKETSQDPMTLIA